MYTNSGQFLDKIQNVSVAGYDHNLITARLYLSSVPYRPKVIEVRKIKEITPEQFDSKFNSKEHLDFWFEADVDRMVKIYAEAVQEVLDELAPVKKVKINSKHAQYLTHDHLQEIKHRDNLRMKAIASGSEHDWAAYRRYRNMLRNKLTKARKAKIKSNISESVSKKDSRTVWRMIKDNSG